MEYTSEERDFLSLTGRTNFKNLSKNDVLIYASKLNELHPEVAKQVLAQYPEFVKVLQSSMTEYKGILADVIASDDKSIERFYDVTDKEMDAIDKSREQFYDFAGKVHADLSKCLENPNLTPEEQKAIREQEMEILRMVNQKDSEMREKEMEIVTKVDEKDTQKRTFNWKTISAASTVVIMALGIGASVLGGNFNLKLPKKS